MRLGPLACGNTYRNPDVLAKQAVTADQSRMAAWRWGSVPGGRTTSIGPTASSSAVLGEHCARLGWDPAEIERSSVALLFRGEPVVPQP